MTASKKLQSAPSIFEPDSIYLLFVKRDDQTCAGVFHHNSDGKGILAFACMKQQGAIHADTLFEYDLTQGIESKFDVIIAHKVAKLHYHEWLRNDHFVSPDFVPISEDHWMAHVLRDLDEKSERKELVWVNRCRPEFPKDFADLARLHVPSLLYFFEKDARYWLAFLSHLEDDTPQYEW